MLIYLRERQRQVSAVNVFYDETSNLDEPQVEEYSVANVPVAMLRRPFVFVLFISVLPDLEEDGFQITGETINKTQVKTFDL